MSDDSADPDLTAATQAAEALGIKVRNIERPKVRKVNENLLLRCRNDARWAASEIERLRKGGKA